MKKIRTPSNYSKFEENFNIYSHGTGLILSIVALILLIFRAVEIGNLWNSISFPVFGISLIILYLASTLYHSAKKEKSRYHLKIFDHAAIYVLIAGTYTPFALVTLNGATGWAILSVIWGLTLVGIVLKIFFTGRFEILSTVMYVCMGLLIFFSFNTLLTNLYINGIIWLFAGGAAYITGAVFYSIDKIKLNHAIFHVLVLIGSFCHFVSIYCYVIPLNR